MTRTTGIDARGAGSGAAAAGPSPALAHIAFTVDAPPVTWKRARRGADHSYTDPRAAAHMDRIRAAARNAGLRMPRGGPAHLRFTVYVACDPTELRAGDLDNHEKILKDALNGIAWRDDRQVVHVEKWKARDDSWPRTEVALTLECEPITRPPVPDHSTASATTTSRPPPRAGYAAADNLLAALHKKPARTRLVSAQRRLKSSVRRYSP